MQSEEKKEAITEHSKDAWKNLAQEGEYAFHARDTWRRTAHFREQTAELFRHFGFGHNQFLGKTVVDLGAGSMLRAKFFEGADIIVIEPLADRILANIEWTDIGDAKEVHSTPAEELVTSLVGKADFLFSMNVLDHCYNFKDISINIRKYLKPDGVAFLSFDKHEVADDMHPLHLDEEICSEIFDSCGFKILKVSTGTGDILPKNTYGHGPYCINFWLTPK